MERLMKKEKNVRSRIRELTETLREIKESVSDLFQDGYLIIIVSIGVLLICGMLLINFSLPEVPKMCNKMTFHEGDVYEIRVRCPEEIKD